MLEESLVGLVIAATKTIAGYFLKNVNHSECWTRDKCCDCSIISSKQSKSSLATPHTVIEEPKTDAITSTTV